MNRETFSIIGTGFIFPKHIEAIKSVRGEICDVVNDSHNENDWKKMLERTRAKHIVILTPNDLHFKMIKKASDMGKTVLCEKPLVINSEEAEELAKKDNVFNVLQLRYHPMIERIRQEQLIKEKRHNIKMNIYFKRDDQDYIKGWKNKRERSGGFLFNLGIHYFDMLLYLFGEEKDFEIKEKITEENNNGPKASAKIEIRGKNYKCDLNMFVNKEKNGEIEKKREFIINGTSYNFSSKDNLAEENLHPFVYQSLLEGKGATPKEALKSIKLIEKIYQSYEK